eukprot:scaffold1054_cov366-Prasinococcus_capsulatus_cf.AAC.3
MPGQFTKEIQQAREHPVVTTSGSFAHIVTATTIEYWRVSPIRRSSPTRPCRCAAQRTALANVRWSDEAVCPFGGEQKDFSTTFQHITHYLLGPNGGLPPRSSMLKLHKGDPYRRLANPDAVRAMDPSQYDYRLRC